MIWWVQIITQESYHFNSNCLRRIPTLKFNISKSVIKYTFLSKLNIIFAEKELTNIVEKIGIFCDYVKTLNDFN